MSISNLSREDILSLDSYIKAISKGNSHISAEYEKELIHQYRNGSETEKRKSLDTLVSYNVTIFADIAISVINSMKGGDRIDPLDLMQLGVITFMKKLKTWDETKGSKMITYYYREVRTQMQRFIMAHAFPVRQGSVFLQHLAYTLSKISGNFLQKYKREPTIRELSKRAKVSSKTIRYCYRVTSVTSLSLEDAPPLYKMNDYDEDFHPMLQLIEGINRRLDLKNTDSLFHLHACLEEGALVPESTLLALKRKIK